MTYADALPERRVRLVEKPSDFPPGETYFVVVDDTTGLRVISFDYFARELAVKAAESRGWRVVP